MNRSRSQPSARPGRAARVAVRRSPTRLAREKLRLGLDGKPGTDPDQDSNLSANWYGDLFNFAPVGYMTLDRFGLILAVNQTGAEMLGYATRHLVGLPFRML